LEGKRPGAQAEGREAQGQCPNLHATATTASRPRGLEDHTQDTRANHADTDRTAAATRRLLSGVLDCQTRPSYPVAIRGRIANVESVSPSPGLARSPATQHAMNHEQPQTLVVSNTELPGLLSTAHREGRKASVELIGRCPPRWRVRLAEKGISSPSIYKRESPHLSPPLVTRH
jgi:hypothetical protein